jgi:hypothetical protein
MYTEYGRCNVFPIRNLEEISGVAINIHKYSTRI